MGYLTKEASGADLLAAICALHAGQRFLPKEIVQSIASRESWAELTRRERQVLEQLASGAPNREIARSLEISERTVAIYVSSILSKFDAQSRTEAVAVAIRRGLIHGGAS